MAKKRGNGEGSITRRKNGGWMAQYTAYTSEGRKRKTLYGKTRQEVAAKLARALSDQEGGLAFNAGNLTVEGWLALQGLERPEEVAARRGLPLEDVAPAALLRARAGVGS